MYLTLVELKTRDGLALPGLLYEPEHKATKKVVIFLHGNGSSSAFYDVKHNNTVADVFNRAGISYCAFNNRGAHYIQKLTRKVHGKEKERVNYGTAFELIKDCIYDIDSALSYLKSQGYEEFYLMGSSTGANKICVYNFYKPRNPVQGYVLVSGADDMGVYYKALGPKRFMYFLNRAKIMARTAQKRELIPEIAALYHPMSWQALYDTINPDGDYNIFPFLEDFKKLGLSKKKLFRHFSALRKPTLVVYGSEDIYCSGKVSKAVETLKHHVAKGGKVAFQIFDNADHGLSGHEKEFARAVVKWIKNIKLHNTE